MQCVFVCKGWSKFQLKTHGETLNQYQPEGEQKERVSGCFLLLKSRDRRRGGTTWFSVHTTDRLYIRSLVLHGTGVLVASWVGFKQRGSGLLWSRYLTKLMTKLRELARIWRRTLMLPSSFLPDGVTPDMLLMCKAGPKEVKLKMGKSKVPMGKAMVGRSGNSGIWNQSINMFILMPQTTKPNKYL